MLYLAQFKREIVDSLMSESFFLWVNSVMFSPGDIAVICRLFYQWVKLILRLFPNYLHNVFGKLSISAYCFKLLIKFLWLHLEKLYSLVILLLLWMTFKWVRCLLCKPDGRIVVILYVNHIKTFHKNCVKCGLCSVKKYTFIHIVLLFSLSAQHVGL